MSYQIQLASVTTPAVDMDVFPFMNKLRADAGDAPPSALLKRFHDALAALFPDTPWADGHFAGDAGRITVVRRRKVVVPHVLYIAGELGLTVVDNQSGEVHRPPTYQVVLEGPAEGVELGDAAAKLAALMRKPVTEMLALLSGGRRTVVKKGVSRFVAEQYASALRERAGCRTTLAHESGPAPLEKPPAPAIVLAPRVEEPPKNVMPPMSRAAKAEAEAEVAAEAALTAHGTDAELFDVAEGIRLICCGIVLGAVLRGVLQMMPPVPKGFSVMLLAVMQFYGVLRLTSGLRLASAVRTALILAVLSPIFVGFAAPFMHLSLRSIDGSGVVSFLVMLALCVMGRRRLKKAGYRTGLFGASKADVRYLGAMGDRDRLQSTKLAWGAFFLVFAINITSGMTEGPGSAAAPGERHDLPGLDIPCEYVGTWEVVKDYGKFEFDIRDDGRYSAVQITGRPREGLAEFGGRWAFARNAIYFSDEARVPVSVMKNNVAAVYPDSITALEGNEGMVTYRLKNRGRSLRCKY